MKKQKEPDKFKKQGKPSASKKNELSPAELALRQHQTSFLLQGPEDLLKKEQELKKSRAKEVIELRSGEVIAFAALMAAEIQEYFPIFPNSNPFFTEMFRLVGAPWKGWNPHAYVKPLEAKLYLVEIIYYRFSKEAVQTLRAGVKRGRNVKLFQLLNEEGRKKVETFRDEAVDMMRTFGEGEIEKFRIAYAKKYNTPVQLVIGQEV